MDLDSRNKRDVEVAWDVLARHIFSYRYKNIGCVNVRDINFKEVYRIDFADHDQEIMYAFHDKIKNVSKEYHIKKMSCPHGYTFFISEELSYVTDPFQLVIVATGSTIFISTRTSTSFKFDELPEFIHGFRNFGFYSGTSTNGTILTFLTDGSLTKGCRE